MKIFGIGMNYAAHNKELQNSLLNIEAPVVFTKADSALLSGGKPFFIPAYTKRCDYETELCVRINHLGRSIPERFAHRYYDEVTVGIDFTARDMQEQLRQKGLPWDLCKGFDGSAAIGKWMPLSHYGKDIQDLQTGELHQSVLHTQDGRHHLHRHACWSWPSQRGKPSGGLPRRRKSVGI